MAIETLIDKRDTLEVVRDAVATILLAESANQQDLAVASGKDPRLWALRVFDGAAQPHPQFLEAPAQLDGQPVVNLLVESTEVDREASDSVERQQVRITFALDCYGYGSARADGAGGQVSGDHQAALEAQRAARLVRNIVMAGNYAYLGLRGLVGRRMIRSLTMFEPDLETLTAAQCVVGCRLSLEVVVAETSPQPIPVGVEAVGVELSLLPTGEIVVAAEWPTTAYEPPDPEPYEDPPLTGLLLQTLIDKQDTLERVRGAVSDLLASETAMQQALAFASGRDPRSSALRVFEERRRPWGLFDVGEAASQADLPPVVNVRLDTATLEPRGSDPILRQTYDARFHVDVLAVGLSGTDTSGHRPGDQEAAREAQRAAALVRNMIMAAHHTYLGLRGLVGRRMVESAVVHPPEPLATANVALVRLTVAVRLVEVSPQVELETVEGIDAELIRQPTGEVLVTSQLAANEE